MPDDSISGAERKGRIDALLRLIDSCASDEVRVHAYVAELRFEIESLNGDVAEMQRMVERAHAEVV